MFEIIDKEPSGTVIKVVGVGGAGGNAVDHMIREGVQGVEFICANTDAQALNRSDAHRKLQLGKGLGAGGKPEAGRALAEVERERIAEALRAPTWPSSPPAWAAAPAPAPRRSSPRWRASWASSPSRW
jgi:cell division protein FtsZ